MKAELLDKKTEMLARANEVAYGLELLRQDEDNAHSNPLLKVAKDVAAVGGRDAVHEDKSTDPINDTHGHQMSGWAVTY